MKTIMKAGRVVYLTLVLLLVATMGAVKAQPGMRVSFQLFYDELAPYGEWVNDPEYGYVWLPHAEPGFQPYASNGYWVMTTYGNTWVSNYPWGWAAFHYGRWLYSDYYGWAWVPGYEWGPAWVSWRSGGGYYGWAPLGPRMSIHVHVGIPHHHWVFVPQRYICHPRMHRYYVTHNHRVNIYNRTTIINNTYVVNNRTYVSGPRRSEIERATGTRVTVREVNHASRPGRASVDSRTVSIYRPDIDNNSRSAARPARVTDAAAVRTASRSNDRPDTRSSRQTPDARASRNTPAAPSSRSTSEVRSAAPRTNERRQPVATEPRNNRRETPATPGRSNTERATPARGAARPNNRETVRASEGYNRNTTAPVRAVQTNSRERVTAERSRNTATAAQSRVSRTAPQPKATASKSNDKRSTEARSRNTGERSSRGRN